MARKLKKKKNDAPEAVVTEGKSDEELRKQLAELRRESLNLRFQQASGQLENTARRRVVRRDIARVHTRLTALRGAERSAAQASASGKENR